MFPHGNVPLYETIAAPDVVHQNVQTTLLTFDTCDQIFHLCVVQVIDLHGNRSSTFSLDQLRRLFNRLRPVHLGALRLRRPPGAINHRPRRPKLERNPSPRRPRRPRHERHLAFKPLFIPGISSILSTIRSTAGEEDFRLVDLRPIAVGAAHELHEFLIIVLCCVLIARELGRTCGAV